MILIIINGLKNNWRYTMSKKIYVMADKITGSSSGYLTAGKKYEVFDISDDRESGYITNDSGTTKVYNTSDFGFNSWPWQNYSQPLHFLCLSQGSYYSNANFLANYMYNRELTTTELNSLYAAKKINIC
jgi:hypothetical protein